MSKYLCKSVCLAVKEYSLTSVAQTSTDHGNLFEICVVPAIEGLSYACTEPK